MAVLKQPQNSPLTIENQIIIIYAVVHDLLTDVEVGDVQQFADDLFLYVGTNYPQIIEKLQETKTLDDETAALIEQAIAGCKQKFVPVSGQ